MYVWQVTVTAIGGRGTVMSALWTLNDYAIMLFLRIGSFCFRCRDTVDNWSAVDDDVLYGRDDRKKRLYILLWQFIPLNIILFRHSVILPFIN